MRESRFASVLVAAATVSFATPSFALVHLQPHGGGWGGGYHGGGMSMMPKPSMHGGGWGGGQKGGCCGGSTYGGGGHMAWHGGKPALGVHVKSIHFYGMGGGGFKYGGGTYGMGGSHIMYAPSGTHVMGMHYYGMSGGSLAAKYGQLEHSYGTPVAGSWGSAYGGHPGSWGTPPTSGHGYSHRYAFHASFGFEFAYRAKVKSTYTRGYKPTGGGTWGYSSPSSSSYAAY